MKTSQIHLLSIVLMVACSPNQTDRKAADLDSEPYKGPVIDMHSHNNKQPTGMYGQEMYHSLTDTKYMGSADLDAHRNETFEMYKKYNVVKAVVSHYGEEWEKHDSTLVLSGKGQRFTIPQLRQYHHAGKLDLLAEMAPNYQGLLPTDSSLTKYYDLAVELDLPMGYHLYPGGPPGGAYFIYPKTRGNQGRPLLFKEILLERPTLRLYIMHAAWPYLEDLKALMYAHPQVYVEVGVISWALPRAEFHKFLRGIFDAGFGDRVMFGTDQMEWPGTIADAFEAVNSADFLSYEQKEDIFYNNAARFLRFSEDEIAAHKSEVN